MPAYNREKSLEQKKAAKTYEGPIVPDLRASKIKAGPDQEKPSLTAIRVLPVTQTGFILRKGLFGSVMDKGERKYRNALSADNYGIKDWFYYTNPEAKDVEGEPFTFADYAYTAIQDLAKKHAHISEVLEAYKDGTKMQSQEYVMAYVTEGSLGVEFLPTITRGADSPIKLVELKTVMRDQLDNLFAAGEDPEAADNYFTWGEGKAVIIRKYKDGPRDQDVVYTCTSSTRRAQLLPSYLLDSNLPHYELGTILYPRHMTFEQEQAFIQAAFGLTKEQMKHIVEGFMEHGEATGLGIIMEDSLEDIKAFVNNITKEWIQEGIEADGALEVDAPTQAPAATVKSRFNKAETPAPVETTKETDFVAAVPYGGDEMPAPDQQEEAPAKPANRFGRR